MVLRTLLIIAIAAGGALSGCERGAEDAATAAPNGLRGDGTTAEESTQEFRGEDQTASDSAEEPKDSNDSVSVVHESRFLTVSFSDGFEGLEPRSRVVTKEISERRRSSNVTWYHLQLTESATSKTIGYIELGTPRTPWVSSRDRVYVTVDDGESENLVDELWVIDLASLEVRQMSIQVGSDFAVDTTGDIVCWAYPRYTTVFEHPSIPEPEVLALPVIRVRNLQTGEEVEHDFSDSFLDGLFGITVDIEYLEDDSAFWVQWSIDAPGNYGEDLILVDTMEYVRRGNQ